VDVPDGSGGQGALHRFPTAISGEDDHLRVRTHRENLADDVRAIRISRKLPDQAGIGLQGASRFDQFGNADDCRQDPVAVQLQNGADSVQEDHVVVSHDHVHSHPPAVSTDLAARRTSHLMIVAGDLSAVRTQS
jgi:hypothetical protein